MCLLGVHKMPPTTSKLGSGKTLRSQSQEIVYNVFQYMINEKAKGGPTKIDLNRVLERVAEATGVSVRAVANIVKLGKKVDNKEVSSFLTPGKKRPKLNTKINLDDFDKCLVRRTIYNFHKTNHERPTILKLKRKLEEDANIKLSLSSLRRVVRKLGFRWKKTEDCRKILIERHDIRLLRTKYLVDVNRFRSEGRPIVYSDETYVHSTHTKPFSWTDGSSKGLKTPISKGQRLIVVHAGWKEGFISNALLTYKSNQSTGDYHHDMNFDNYYKWLKEKLIPNLPPRSVLVIDNASYHNVQCELAPTSSTRKQEMMDWLQRKGIPFRTEMLKAELYELIKLHKSSYKRYKVDELLSSYGHSVLRLPPYHPDLNAIENIWAQLKDYVAQKNVFFSLEGARTLLEDKVAMMGKEEWAKICDKVLTTESNYMAAEHLMDEVSERLIINLEEDSDTSDSDSDDSDSDSYDTTCDVQPLH